LQGYDIFAELIGGRLSQSGQALGVKGVRERQAVPTFAFAPRLPWHYIAMFESASRSANRKPPIWPLHAARASGVL